MNGIARTDHDTQFRGLARLGDGRLTAGDRRGYRPGSKPALFPSNIDKKVLFSSTLTKNSVPSTPALTKAVFTSRLPGNTAEEMGSPLEEFDPGGLVLFHSPERDRRVLIETEDRLVDQGNVSPAFLQDPNGITRTVGVVQFDSLPLRLPRPFDLYGSLN